jgi:F-type H+-transporting ATPase subunit delta
VRITRQARRDAKRLFRCCQINGLLDDQKARQAVQLVIARKPRGYGGILAHFHRLLRLDLERRAARVESATPLDGAMEGALRASLTRKYGAGLNFAFSQNPSLLGGLRIKVGSDVFDSSILARLNALADSF